MTTNAKRDENHVPTLIATLNSDGSSIVLIEATSAHALMVDDGTGGTDNGGTHAGRDENHVPVLLCESSNNDGSLVAVYGNNLGKLLINSS